MPQVEGLRSCYGTVGGIVFFGRMLDKIRLHAAGRLPEEYHGNIAKGFDARTCAFLGVDHGALGERVLAGGTDEEILAWCLEKGGPRSDDARYIWNRFMMKVGWRDERSEGLKQRLAEYPDPAEAYRAMSATQLNGRMAKPEEIAAAALYLAADEAAMVTGSAMLVDGGWSAGK